MTKAPTHFCPRCGEDRPDTEFVIIFERVESKEFPPVKVLKHRRCRKMTMVESKEATA